MAKKKSGKVVNVNMQGVESSSIVKEGDHIVTVLEVEHGMSESSGKPKLTWQFEVEGGGKLYHTTSLQPQALFNLKNVLIALGQSVPNSTMKLDLEELVGLTCGVTVGHEMYDGKKKSRITDFFPVDDEDAVESDDEEEVEEDEEEESEDEEEEVDLDELDLEELLAYAAEHDIKIAKKIKDNEKKVRKAIQDALDI